MIIAVFDGSVGLEERDIQLAEQLRGRTAVAVINKTDLGRSDEMERLRSHFEHIVELSARSGDGAERLGEEIRAALKMSATDTSEPMLANERQRRCILRACEAVQEAASALEQGVTLDAVNVCIDEGIAALLELDGTSVTEAVVDDIFANFCVGK